MTASLRRTARSVYHLIPDPDYDTALVQYRLQYQPDIDSYPESWFEDDRGHRKSIQYFRKQEFFERPGKVHQRKVSEGKLRPHFAYYLSALEFASKRSRNFVREAHEEKLMVESALRNVMEQRKFEAQAKDVTPMDYMKLARQLVQDGAEDSDGADETDADLVSLIKDVASDEAVFDLKSRLRGLGLSPRAKLKMDSDRTIRREQAEAIGKYERQEFLDGEDEFIDDDDQDEDEAEDDKDFLGDRRLLYDAVGGDPIEKYQLLERESQREVDEFLKEHW